MKSMALRFMLAILFFGFLSVPKTAISGYEPARGPTEVTNEMNGLEVVMMKIEGLELDLKKADKKVETKILGVSGRQSIGNVIARDKMILGNYMVEAWNHIGFLRDHWESLSDAQKSEVTQDQLDLGDMEGVP